MKIPEVTGFIVWINAEVQLITKAICVDLTHDFRIEELIHTQSINFCISHLINCQVF